MQYPVAQVPIQDIIADYPGFTNCRTTLGDLTELKASIEQKGLMTPPMVWKTADEEGTEKYVLIAGYRRLQAIKDLIEEVEGFDELYAEINCTLVEGDLDDALVLNMAENVQREDLNPADAIEAAGRLYERLGTQEKVAAVLGKKQPWVSGLIKLNRQLCPDVLDALREEKITLKQSREIAELFKKGQPQVEAQQAALAKILAPADAEKKSTAKKKEPTSRSKADIMQLRKALVTEEDLDIDEAHRASLLTFTRWFLMEIGDEEILTRMDVTDDYVQSVKDELLEIEKPRSAGRPRMSEEEKAEREAERAQKKAEEKAAREAQKAADKAANEQKKADEKAAKLAEAEKKKAEALAKAAEKKANTERRAAERAQKESEKAAKAEKAAADQAAAAEAAAAKTKALKPTKVATPKDKDAAPKVGRKLPG